MWDPSNEFLGAWGPTKPDPVPEEWGEDYSWYVFFLLFGTFPSSCLIPEEWGEDYSWYF